MEKIRKKEKGRRKKEKEKRNKEKGTDFLFINEYLGKIACYMVDALPCSLHKLSLHTPGQGWHTIYFVFGFHHHT